MQKHGLTLGVNRKERSSMDIMAMMVIRSPPVVGPFRKVNGTISGAGKGVFLVLFSVFFGSQLSSCFT